MAQWSSLVTFSWALSEDVRAASSHSVLGHWKVGDVPSLFVAVDTFQHSFLGLKAFALASAGGAGLLLHLWCHLREKLLQVCTCSLSE